MNAVSLILIFTTVSQTFNLPPGLLSALCYVESNHRVKALNINDGGSSSFGVCQIKYKTAVGLGFDGSKDELKIPQVNAYYAGKYLSSQIERYNGDIRKGIAAYNAGKHKVNSQGLTINTRYVNKVFTAWAENR